MHTFDNTRVADADELPDCGPQPILREPKMRQPDETDTSCKSATTTSARPQATQESDAKLRVREPIKFIPTKESYLVNTTVGEEYAPCVKCLKKGCKTKQTYYFGQVVTAQCYTEYVAVISAKKHHLQIVVDFA